MNVFAVNELVLCYEPDKTKAKVLYDSKILGVSEADDKRGRKSVQYKVHFQGWSSSWDRKVNADYILKDTPENRQLQRELAEKAKLQLGAYLYRKERNSKKRSRKLYSAVRQNSQNGFEGVAHGNNNSNSRHNLNKSPLEFDPTAADHNSSSKLRPRVSSEDNFSSSSTIERSEDFAMKERCEVESDSYCSSAESFYDEDRVLLRISERLRQHLENDGEMIKNYGKQHILPAGMPAIMILENFVKWSATKMVLAVLSAQFESSRRRGSMQRITEKKEREIDKIFATATQLKEVADGLRIYFDFIVSDYLLYKEEREYALQFLSEDYFSKQSYVVKSVYTPLTDHSLENSKDDSDQIQNDSEAIATIHKYGNTEKRTITNILDDKTPSANIPNSTTREETQKRKLRSHNRIEDADPSLGLLGNNLNNSVPLDANIIAAIDLIDPNLLKPVNMMMLNTTPQIRDFLHNILSWHLLPNNAMFGPSMVFGAVHLARLLVKLPEFLNASAMSDEKLRMLLQHLESFANYLESRNDWFSDDNYLDKYKDEFKSGAETPNAYSFSQNPSSTIQTENAEIYRS